MIGPFKYPYPYDYDVVSDWNSSAIGVYYCGVITSEKKLAIYYIGRAVGDGGIRGRLLQHLSEAKWEDVSHFGYHVCGSASEALAYEKDEIARYNPKYNTVGVL